MQQKVYTGLFHQMEHSKAYFFFIMVLMNLDNNSFSDL